MSIHIRWEEGIINKCFVYNNYDIEEHFHWYYGPYITNDYHIQLESMLNDIIVYSKGNNYGDKWFMCSTVRMKISCYKNILQLNIIIIRSRLQRSKLFGKILLYIANNLEDDITFIIKECYEYCSSSIDKYYFGCDILIFERIEYIMRSNLKKVVDYKLKDKKLFLQKNILINYKVLNEIENLEQISLLWTNAAILCNKYNICVFVINNQFGFDFFKEITLESTIYELNNSKNDIGELKNIFETIYSIDNFSYPIFYVKDLKLLDDFKSAINELKMNDFITCYDLNVDINAKSNLTYIYNILNNLNDIIKNKCIQANTYYTCFENFKSYSDLLCYEYRFIDYNTAMNHALHKLISGNLSNKIKISAHSSKIHFKFDSSLKLLEYDFISKIESVFIPLNFLIK
jgi:hypothetical protein